MPAQKKFPVALVGGWGMSCVSGVFREATPSDLSVVSMVSGRTGTNDPCLLFLFFFLFFEIMCVCMLVCACLHVHACLYAHCMYAVPVEVRRGRRIHWSGVMDSENQLATELTIPVNATSLLS